LKLPNLIDISETQLYQYSQEIMDGFTTVEKKKKEPKAAAIWPQVLPMVEISQNIIPYEAFKALPKYKRGELLKGPTITLSSRGKDIVNIPKRLLMAVSPLGNRYCTEHQKEEHMVLNDVVSGFYAVQHIVSYLINVCRTLKFYSLPYVGDLKMDLEIYIAARHLEMYPNLQHVLVHLKGEIQNERGIIGYDELDTILAGTGCCRLDPLVVYMAETLARLRYRNEIPDPSEFGAWLQRYPILYGYMAEIDREYEEKREEAEEARAARKARKADKFRKIQQTKQELKEAESNMSHPGAHQISAEAARKLKFQR
jgi:hypothetical protein